MIPRLLKLPNNKSFFLLGPRGTGKTTWLRRQLPDARVFDLLDDTTYQRYLTSPSRLEEDLTGHPADRWIVIDEVQRVPALLNQIHRLIELHRYCFAITGSSARKLRSKGVNLLAGRALTLEFFPLTAAEQNEKFNLKHALRFGMLPGLAVESSPEAFLKSYVVTYLREEVQQEGLVRNLASFSRFLEAASFSQGQVLNVSKVASECAVERKVVENYFSIVEDLLIGFRLSVFSRKAKRKLLHHQKFYFFDCGVFRTLHPKGPLDSEAELDGPALETLVVQEARALSAYYDWDYSFHYWRTADHRFEVDLVAYGARGLIALEVKRNARVTDEDRKGLNAFLED